MIPSQPMWGVVRSALAWLLLGFLLLPVFTTIPFALSDRSYLSLPGESLSLEPFRDLFASRAWLSSLIDSLVIATGATLLATTLGTTAAIGLWRLRSPAVGAIRALALAPLILPQVLSALAFYRLFADLGLLDTRWGAILAHGVLGVPFVVITVSTSLASFDPSLERAARSLGAGLGMTLWRVFLPSIRPGVLAGAVFAFLASWDELVVTIFITGIDVVTVPRRIWSGLRDNADPTIAACATLLIVLTTTLGILHIAWTTRRARKRGGRS